MTRFALTALLAVVPALLPALVEAQVPAPHEAEHREFVVSGFRTESGIVLPLARVVRGTHGRLEAARDHVMLLPIPSLWGHPAGAGANPEDKRFLNERIAAFLAGGNVRREQ